VDVIEQSVAYALTHGRTRIDVATAREAVAAMTGMPLDPTRSLAALAATLDDRAILDPAARRALLARLSVSMHGYDARRERPDGVILLCDGAAAAADPLADAVARLLFGRETARIDIDLGGLTQDHSISSLLGSAPGLVDSERPLALHALRRSPWQVVLLRAIEACSESVRGTIAAALASGTFTDAMGRVIPLGATVVILTAPEIGAGSDTPDAVVLAARLGPALLGTCDVVTGTGAGVDDGGRRAWVVRELLDPLAARLARRGYGTTFDPDFVAWLVARLPRDGTPPDQYLDRSVTPLIVAGLPATAARIAIGVQDDRPVVRATAADDAAQPPA
jgi:hypothetical protein